MECLKHWLGKDSLDQLNIDLPPEEGGGESELETQYDTVDSDRWGVSSQESGCLTTYVHMLIFNIFSII
jgi:hypothetical protein